LFVCILPEKAVIEMTYTVSGGTLNPTHSLTSVTEVALTIVHLIVSISSKVARKLLCVY